MKIYVNAVKVGTTQILASMIMRALTSAYVSLAPLRTVRSVLVSLPWESVNVVAANISLRDAPSFVRVSVY